MNSPIRYYGGKYYLRPYLLNIINYYFPDHRTYAEPSVGGGSLFFAKQPSKCEIISDVDQDLINFYVQVRDQYEILMDVIDGFDYSRESFEQSKGYGEKTDPTERAAYWFVNNRLSYSGKGEYFSKSSYVRRGMEEKTSAYLTAIQGLKTVSKRLANVEIKCCSFESTIPSNPNWLIYLDPPYLKDSRITQANVYKYEMDYAQHKLMLDLVMNSDSKSIISHYTHPLYMDRLKGLTKFEIKNYNHGSQKINKLNEHIWVKA